VTLVSEPDDVNSEVDGSSISPHSRRHNRPGYVRGLVRPVGDGRRMDDRISKVNSLSFD
jgi:hypothetical protein